MLYARRTVKGAQFMFLDLAVMRGLKPVHELGARAHVSASNY